MSSEQYDLVIRRYPLGQPKVWPDMAIQQLRGQNRLWNRLVETENVYRDAYDRLQGAIPDVAEAKAISDELKQQRADLIAEKKKLNARNRTKVPTPELDAPIAALDTPIKEAAMAVGEAKQHNKDLLADPPEVAALKQQIVELIDTPEITAPRQRLAQSALMTPSGVLVTETLDASQKKAIRDQIKRLTEAAKMALPKETRDRIKRRKKEIAAEMRRVATGTDTLADHEMARFDAAKTACREAVRNGLYWGNCNAVDQSFKVARVRAMQARTRLHFHHFDGGGRNPVRP